MEIRRLDPYEEDQAEAVYRALRVGASADREAPVVEERHALLASLRGNASNPNTDRRAYGAWQGSECLGALLLSLPRRENTHIAEIEVSVPPGAKEWAPRSSSMPAISPSPKAVACSRPR